MKTSKTFVNTLIFVSAVFSFNLALAQQNDDGKFKTLKPTAEDAKKYQDGIKKQDFQKSDDGRFTPPKTLKPTAEDAKKYQDGIKKQDNQKK
jgi:hypothetical protein